MLTRASAARMILPTFGILVAFTLSGCATPGGDNPPTLSPSTSQPAPTPSTSQTPEPSASAEPAEKPTPVSIPCTKVVDQQTMYDFNPNFGLLTDFTPPAGSVTARAAADSGTVCRWMNQTSDDTIDVSISQPGPNALAALLAAAKTGTSVSGLGDAAYFSTTGGAGTVQVFAGQRWITTTSVYFSSASDASSIIADAVAAAK